MRLLFWLIRLAIWVGGFPIRLVIWVGRFLMRPVLGGASAIGRRLKWLRPVAQIGLNLLVIVRGNSIASTAIILSVINFGLLIWQIWPEDTGQTITVLSQPTENLETLEIENTLGRISELEIQIQNLSREQRFQFDRLRECINYPSPFGCE